MQSSSFKLQLNKHFIDGIVYFLFVDSSSLGTVLSYQEYPNVKLMVIKVLSFHELFFMKIFKLHHIQERSSVIIFVVCQYELQDIYFKSLFGGCDSIKIEA